MDEFVANEEYYPVERDWYSKDNTLISSAYKSTLLENRLLSIAMFKIDTAVPDREGHLHIDIPAFELRRLIPKSNGGSFYKQLNTAADNMVSKSIGITDPEHNYFSYVSLIHECTYDNGVLTIIFDKKIRTYIKYAPITYLICSI